MIDRVRTLVATQAVLVQRELGSREQVEEEHAQLQRYLEESNNKVLQCNNRLAELQTQLEQARVRVHQWVGGEAATIGSHGGIPRTMVSGLGNCVYSTVGPLNMGCRLVS